MNKKKWVHHNDTSKEKRNHSNVVSDIRELLFNAVETQLHSDVTNGLFLSGGIDSTLLLAISNEVRIKNLPSFSIINNSEDRNFGTDDYLYANKAAKVYNSEHIQILIDDKILKYTEELIQQLDQPIGDSALLLTWLLSENASTKIRVALSGAGADEWFAGYNRHWAYAKYLNTLYGNNLLIKSSNLLSGIIPEGFSHPLRKQARLWNKFSSKISTNPIETYDNFRSLNFPKSLMFTSAKGERFETISNDQLLELAFTKDRNDYLASDLLLLTDKMSMLKSLEVRLPYLDNNLTDYLSNLSPIVLLKNGPKWILKELLQNLGGKEFTHRKKEGFGMPIGKWIKEKQNKFLLLNLENKNSTIYNYISFEIVAKLLSDHLSNKKDYSSELWSLIVLTNWVQKEF